MCYGNFSGLSKFKLILRNAKKTIITGLIGQDRSCIAELLVDKGYQVCGLVRHSSTSNLVSVSHFTDNINIISGDLLDQPSLMDAITEAAPDEIYNLASQTYVPISYTQESLTLGIFLIAN